MNIDKHMANKVLKASFLDFKLKLNKTLELMYVNEKRKHKFIVKEKYLNIFKVFLILKHTLS